SLAWASSMVTAIMVLNLSPILCAGIADWMHCARGRQDACLDLDRSHSTPSRADQPPCLEAPPRRTFSRSASAWAREAGRRFQAGAIEEKVLPLSNGRKRANNAWIPRPGRPARRADRPDRARCRALGEARPCALQPAHRAAADDRRRIAPRDRDPWRGGVRAALLLRAMDPVDHTRPAAARRDHHGRTGA